MCLLLLLLFEEEREKLRCVVFIFIYFLSLLLLFVGMKRLVAKYNKHMGCCLLITLWYHITYDVITLHTNINYHLT